ncbi:hypothetical protein HB852_00115 [Listeria grandensis]|uniref:Uncharacterized protein n=1 Tax=Listeria grandensis TaxID=1494963 RepID=A0A7X0Y0V6_9LIST|nr:hypothetical protein [Listeria grandensis]MBC1473019.1 hypothetical protein [Listeria grandensis]MBC1934962.1 hypothetical protein [Listeria grandensis]
MPKNEKWKAFVDVNILFILFGYICLYVMYSGNWSESLLFIVAILMAASGCLGFYLSIKGMQMKRKPMYQIFLMMASIIPAVIGAIYVIVYFITLF